MSRIMWDQTGERRYESGVDHGVLYQVSEAGLYVAGVPWNGLISVNESPTGAEPSPQYADNIKYLTLMSAEEFGASIEAFTYPDTNDLVNAQFVPPPRALLGIGSRIWEGYVSQIQFTEERFNVRMEPIYVKAQITFALDMWKNTTSQRMHQMRRQLLSR